MMFRDKQSYQEDAIRHFSLRSGRDDTERHLLEFMDSFDFFLFVCDPTYRGRLNALLEQLSDEEFEDFTRAHSQRFNVN
jgi:hypothetical protein